MEIYGHSGTGKRKHAEGVPGRNPAGEGREPCCRSSRHLGGAEYTVQIMEQAPVVIFVLNSGGMIFSLNDEDRIYELCNIQSVSAAIENMLLEANGYGGIGSLWIRDISLPMRSRCAWMDWGDAGGSRGLGYPEESPPPRPRKS